ATSTRTSECASTICSSPSPSRKERSSSRSTATPARASPSPRTTPRSSSTSTTRATPSTPAGHRPTRRKLKGPPPKVSAARRRGPARGGLTGRIRGGRRPRWGDWAQVPYPRDFRRQLRPRGEPAAQSSTAPRNVKPASTAARVAPAWSPDEWGRVRAPRGSTTPPHVRPAPALAAPGEGLPVESVSHLPLVPPRLAEIVKERARHLSVSDEAVLHEHTHAGMHFVRGIADVEIRLAGHSLGQMHARGGRAPGVELPERLPRGPARAVQMVHETNDVVLHTLEPADGHAELDAGLRVRDGLLVHGLTGAYDVRAEERQRPLERARQ